MTAIFLGIALQVAMVLVGHAVPAVRDYWGPGGMLLALLVGILAVRPKEMGWRHAIVAGALAGGVGAFVGIVLAFLLHDVPPLLIVWGTLSSVVAGIAGAAGRRTLNKAKKSPVA